MEKEKAIIIFEITKKNLSFDLEVPLSISANDLVLALNSAYELGIDVTSIKNCYLKAERPIALLKGNKSLADFGVRNGTIVYFDK